MSNLIEQAIIKNTDRKQHDAQAAELAVHAISNGLKPLNIGDPRTAQALRHCCDGCGEPEAPGTKFSVCSNCRAVSYCGAACQKRHWKKGHKHVCSRMTEEIEAQGKGIVDDLHNQDIRSFRIIQSDDAVYAMAKKHGLFAVMEEIFRLEAVGGIPGNGSITQELVTSTFKGNRESERFTCACPDRTREYVLSSPTAWESLMDAMLYIATSLKKFENGLFLDNGSSALVHRAARDVLQTMSLALIHEKVAKSIFFGSKKSGNKHTQDEAKAYALETLAPKLQPLFLNGGEGFASDAVDRNMTIRGCVFRFTAYLSYWYGKLVDTEHPCAFVDSMNLNLQQETMYYTLAKPLAEGAVDAGREVTMDETRVLCLNASREYQRRGKVQKAGKKNGKKKGKKNRS